MKLKTGYKIREVAGEYMLIPVGAADMNKVFSLSESAAWLWGALSGRDFDIESAVKLITDEYETDDRTARADVSGFIDILRENGLLDE